MSDEAPSTKGPGVPEPPSPRAFAQGTGLLLQIVGGAMFFLMGGLWCTSSFWDTGAWEDRGSPVVDESGGRPQGRAGAVAMVLAGTAGGLALAVFGLGLQSDQPKAAWGAMGTLGALLGCLGLAGFWLWCGSAGVAARAVHVGLVLVTLVLFGFVAAAMKQVVAHPPPPDQGLVPYDFDPPRASRH